MALSQDEKVTLVRRAFLIYQNSISYLLGEYGTPTEEQFQELAQISLIAAQSFTNATYSEDFFDAVETE